MKTPYWVENFKNFPSIPDVKKWQDKKRWTIEQEIGFKLLRSEKITVKEETDFLEALDFYEKVLPLFQQVNFTEFTQDEVKDFNGYFDYALNHIVEIKNDISCEYIFRLVKNKSIFGFDKRIEHINQLKNPSLDVVKKMGNYNRANTPETTIFYGGDRIDTVLQECKPEINDLITIGIWKIKDAEKRINAYPIVFGKEAKKVNSDVHKGYNAFQQLKLKENSLISKFMELIFDFLGHEFSKSVNNHLDYFLSANYSERIFEPYYIDEYSNNSPQPFEAIIYPSVENKYRYDNTAIKEEIMSEHFYLWSVLEMRVNDTHYFGNNFNSKLFDISRITPSPIIQAKRIQDGRIIW